jgi:AraC family transcriptional regulator
MDATSARPLVTTAGRTAGASARCALSASCTVMTVAYFGDAAAAAAGQGRDVIDILVVAGRPSFQMSHGVSACVTATGDNIAAAADQAGDGRAADAVVITLDRIYFEHRARLALGKAVAKVAAGYAAEDSFVREIGNTLMCDFRAGHIPLAAYLESLAGVLSVHLAAHHCELHPPVPERIGLPRHKLNRVLGFIAENIAEPVHIRDLSAMVHMSLHHFARMFKHAVGMPPHLYITLERVQLAKALLSETEMPLVEVAASVGFQTQGHFTAVFHRYAGITPRGFRLCSRAGEEGAPPRAVARSKLRGARFCTGPDGGARARA